MRRIAERSYSVRFDDGHTVERTGALAGDERGVQGHGRRPVRAIRRRRWQRDLLRLLHGLQRHRHRPATARDEGLPAASRPRQWWERQPPTRASRSSLAGSVDVSPLSLEVIESPTPSPTRRIRIAGKSGSHARRRRDPGKSFNSATAGRRSRPKQAGWCSPTASGPCAPTASGPSCSTSRTPPGSSAGLHEPLLSPAPDEQDGYVPNVVYSCGALLHAGTLVVPVRDRRLCHRRGDRALWTNFSPPSDPLPD